MSISWTAAKDVTVTDKGIRLGDSHADGIVLWRPSKFRTENLRDRISLPSGTHLADLTLDPSLRTVTQTFALAQD